MLRYEGEGKAEAEEEKVEEVKAEINYLLSGNRENDVATAQRFFSSPPPPFLALYSRSRS